MKPYEIDFRIKKTAINLIVKFKRIAKTWFILFRLFLDTRQLYTAIKIVFFKHLPSKVKSDLPNLKPEERSLEEFEKGEIAVQLIKEDIDFVMKGREVR